MAKRSQEDSARAKRELIEAIENHELSLGEAVRRMRKISGMNQKSYAERIIGISPRILAEIERGEGNPTLETLNKIGRPFGYAVGFVPGRQ
ncbi:MAG: helix-turn-helix transcriptional regulator [Gammaproteobacteria bacterium]|nr:helix-turn-helix transcriptional regulator [Gammaproteobacteria bacterium]MDE0508326.1 helix-turn-helix transcriptional regulator [Gammaproteobacteria bacterium]MXX07731.1 helix-turn-helix transcriptional regulator [Gammaproteobacteria bacterium]MXY89722.1 helix-turn-helix transcriptional regulator [Gammaproteobacteria bacterium]MYA36688.1 helix-turn-helix transcriptional regulator [Gammaproteobacteria bacterium]